MLFSKNFDAPSLDYVCDMGIGGLVDATQASVSYGATTRQACT